MPWHGVGRGARGRAMEEPHRPYGPPPVLGDLRSRRGPPAGWEGLQEPPPNHRAPGPLLEQGHIAVMVHGAQEEDEAHQEELGEQLKCCRKILPGS
jgi:hypothetical protein